jgi:serine/threonine protein kinase
MQAMNYPLISEYVEAIKMAEDNFEELSYLQPVLDDTGQPVMSSGNFAVVFKMKDERDGKLYAVRCFHRDQEGRAESYRLIEEELKDVESPYLVSFRYMDKELFVDSSQTDETEFPVLLMDWVEGITLDKYLRENLDDQYALEMLAYRFSQLAQWLIPQPFAHGDLKPDNILVREDGTLVLVDYDGMYVPAMKGQKARELGSPDFRHPLRTEDDFDEHIDDFPLLILTLNVLVACDTLSSFSLPFLIDKDFFNPIDSQSIKKIYPSNKSSINKCVSVIINCLIDNEKAIPIVVYDTIAKHIRWSYYNFAQNFYELTKKQLDDYSFAKKFNKNGRFKIDEINYPICLNEHVEGFSHKLDYGFPHFFHQGCLLAVDDLVEGSYMGDETCEVWKEMCVPSDTIVIGKEAFRDCDCVELIIVPNSVRFIGDHAFYGCKRLRYIVLPDSIEGVGKNPFDLSRSSYVSQRTGLEANSLVNIIVPDGTKEYYVNLLSDYQHLVVDFTEFVNSMDPTVNPLVINIAKKVKVKTEKLIRYEGRDAIVEIPFGTRILCDGAFKGNMNVKRVKLPESLVVYGCKVFYNCKNLESIILPSNLDHIPNDFFYGCEKLKEIQIPSSVKSLGDRCFNGCKRIERISLPSKMNIIGKNVFCNCSSLQSIIMPTEVNGLGSHIFQGCKELKTIVIPKGAKSIPNGMFSGCSFLCEVKMPDDITQIGSDAFDECKSLHRILLPAKLEIIDRGAFMESGIEELNIPYSVNHIGCSAFKNCKSLKFVEIPQNTSLTKLENYIFEGCSSLSKITLSESIEDVGEWTFAGCTTLTNIILPSQIRRIGHGLFSGCINLQSINDLDNIKEIESEAFFNCRMLKYFKLSPSVEKIGHNVFIGMPIQNIDISSDRYEKDHMALYTKDKKKIIEVLMIKSEWEIPNSVETICEWAFNGCSLKKLVIPKSVKNIESKAFVSSPIDIIEIGSMINIESDSFCDEIGAIVVPTHLLNHYISSVQSGIGRWYKIDKKFVGSNNKT